MTSNGFDADVDGEGKKPLHHRIDELEKMIVKHSNDLENISTIITQLSTVTSEFSQRLVTVEKGLKDLKDSTQSAVNSLSSNDNKGERKFNEIAESIKSLNNALDVMVDHNTKSTSQLVDSIQDLNRQYQKGSTSDSADLRAQLSAIQNQVNMLMLGKVVQT